MMDLTLWITHWCSFVQAVKGCVARRWAAKSEQPGLLAYAASPPRIAFASTTERNQPSQESRWRGAKDRRSERSVLYAEPALPGCGEEAEEYSQHELSWLHGLDWRETDAGLEVDGAELPGESKAG